MSEPSGEVWFQADRAVNGKFYVFLYTRGELLPRRPEMVPRSVTMATDIDTWWGMDGVTGFLVNPGTSTEAVFSATGQQRRRWKRLVADVRPREHDEDALITKYTGVLHGPLAHGLACAAHRAVQRPIGRADSA